MRAQTEAPINDAIVNWCSNERWSQCTYRCAVLPDLFGAIVGTLCAIGLNAPTGAWCSLTRKDATVNVYINVSMHLQVRGAP